MSSSTALLVLQQSSIFRGVDSATLEDISKLASTHTYKPGETIFREGEAGNTLHGIVAGQIRITTTSADGQELLLNVIGPGQIVGEIAFLDGGDRTATGTAAVETPCFSIPRAPFFSLMESRPQLAVHILQLVCQRVRWTSRLVADSAFLSLPERLAARLGDLCATANPSPSSGDVEVHISQRDLATFLSVSRQAVNKTLKPWKEAGYLSLSREKIIVHDLERIRLSFAGKLV